MVYETIDNLRPLVSTEYEIITHNYLDFLVDKLDLFTGEDVLSAHCQTGFDSDYYEITMKLSIEAIKSINQIISQEKQAILFMFILDRLYSVITVLDKIEQNVGSIIVENKVEADKLLKLLNRAH